MPGRAIIAGGGALPALLLDAGPAHIVIFGGVETAVDGAIIPARFERLGALFDDLRTAGVSEVCFAGAMQRPKLDPTALDDITKALMPRLMQDLSVASPLNWGLEAFLDIFVRHGNLESVLPQVGALGAFFLLCMLIAALVFRRLRQGG